MSKWASILMVVLPLVSLGSCHRIDDERIPPLPVYISFLTQADWITYGVTAAGDTRSFIKQNNVPPYFPWTALTQTGFGGVLLVSDVFGTPQAFDLACPVECRADIRIYVDNEIQKAVCPSCGSIYEIFTNYGYPVGGVAAEYGYGLRRYYVGPGYQGEAFIITL